MPHTLRDSWQRHHRPERSGAVFACLLAVLCCCLPATGAGADPVRVLVLLSESGGAYSELVDALKAPVDPERIRVQSRRVPDGLGELTQLLEARPALIVPVGLRATAMVLRVAGDLPVLSLLVPQNSYAALRAESAPAPPGRRSAIFMDQPLARQLDLLDSLLPQVRRLGVLAGPDSSAQLPELQRLGESRGLQVISATVAEGDNPVPALARILDRAGALLALPDPAVFNRASLQAILLTTYRSSVPVLGFSQAYVNAGALAAVHSSAQQIGTQAGEWIAELDARGDWQLGTPRDPVYYSVSVNAQVAQSLGIGVADASELLRRLRARETASP